MPPLRRYHHDEFDAVALASAKGDRRVSVVIPARDEATTIGDIVRSVREQLIERTALVDEVLVVDDRSADATRATALSAGARVVTTTEVLPDHPAAGGKGGALWKGLASASGDLVAFVDGDVVDFDPRFVVGLLGPLLSSDHGPGFVKAFYERSLDGAPRGGGRVTELAARPILAILLPHLGDIVQPLAGEFAARRELLEQVPFVEGYGVDIALLADIASRFGVDAIAQVDLGRRVHRNRPLSELTPMATEVLLAALSRAHVEVPDHVRVLLPSGTSHDLTLRERPPLASLNRSPT